MIRSILIVVVAVLISGCGEKEEEVSSMTAASFDASVTPTVAFSVPDMMCPDSCAVQTKQILAEQPGAKDVRVDFETKTATVTVEEDEFDADQALAALVDHGFDHSTVKGGAVAKAQSTDEAVVQ